MFSSGCRCSGFRFPVGIDDFKDVAVGFPEEEALEGGFPDWIDEFGSVGDEALLESREFFEGVVKGKVPTELGFEGRDFEFLDMEKMQLLTIPDSKPGGLNVDVARAGDLFPAKGIQEKFPGRNHIPGGEGEVVKAGEGGIVQGSQCDRQGKGSKSCVLALNAGNGDSIDMKRAVLALALAIPLCPLPGQADNEPTARIRAPKSGEKVDYHFAAKGRSSNIPEGQVVMLFRPIGESGFLFPLSEELKGNRSFTEKIYHEMKDEGRQVIQVRMLPPDLAAKAAKYRREILKWYNGGKKGSQPSLAPGLLENTKRLAEVVYELERE